MKAFFVDPDKYYPACQSGIHLLFCRIDLCCLLQTIAGLMLVWDFVLYLQEKFTALYHNQWLFGLVVEEEGSFCAGRP